MKDCSYKVRPISKAYSFLAGFFFQLILITLIDSFLYNLVRNVEQYNPKQIDSMDYDETLLRAVVGYFLNYLPYPRSEDYHERRNDKEA